MPQLLALNDLIRSKVYCSMDDQLALNVRHWKVTNLIAGAPILEELPGPMSTILGPLYRDIMAGAARYRGFGLQRIHPLPVGMEVSSAEESGTGTNETQPLPPQTCGLLSFFSTQAGRRYRGRTYLPFPTEDFNDGSGRPTGAYLLGASLIGERYRNPWTIVGASGTVTITPVVNWTGVPLAVDGYRYREWWATQRRRSGFGAANIPFPVQPG